MRWKLLKRRLSITAPRVIVRSHLPWPLRWAVAAVMLGFSAALALWAFQFGKDIAGLDWQSKDELVQLRVEVAQLREARDKAQALVHAADSLSKAERIAQDRLTQRVRELEADNLALKADLGFFERLLPADGAEGLSIRGLQANVQSPGQLRYQLLVTQNGKNPVEFKGRYVLALGGLLDGKPWAMPATADARAIQLMQYGRVEGLIDFPQAAVVKTIKAQIIDSAGAVRASHSARL